MSWLRWALSGRRPSGERVLEQGQVLVLFALFLVVLLGISAFVVDVARVYALQRFERSVADAAALAGAQDLQVTGTRDAPTATDYGNALTDALNLLNRELGGPTGTSPSCSGYTQTYTDASGTDYTWYVDCPISGTPYLVSIKTPSPSAVTVTADRAVQVTVRQPTVSTTFARILGQGDWNVGQTSVAGLYFAPQYAVVALQPPNTKRNGQDANLCSNLNVNGNGGNNAVLHLIEGDVGTNTSATTTNQGVIQLDTNYLIDYIDAQPGAHCGLFSDPTWSTDANGDPQGRLITHLIHAPGYKFPSFQGVAPFATQSAGASSCSTADPVDYPTVSSTTTFLTNAAAGGTITCYLPGIYQSKFIVSNSDVAYLAPGAYYFPAGMTVNGTLAGGLIKDQPGVVLVFDESGSSASFVANNSNTQIVLNTGGAPSGVCANNACSAKPAIDVLGNSIDTGAPKNQPLTVEVNIDPNCFSGTLPVYSTCSGDLNNNKTVDITASNLVQIAGVIYGPSDNMVITGGSSQEGYLGQLWSWTVVYTGNSQLNEYAYTGPANGVLRLDSACSGSIGFGTGPGIVCNDP